MKYFLLAFALLNFNVVYACNDDNSRDRPDARNFPSKVVGISPKK